MREDERGEPTVSGRESPGPAGLRERPEKGAQAAFSGVVIETVVSPFHCLYQDALHFHTQSRLAASEAEAAGWPGRRSCSTSRRPRPWSIRRPSSWAGPSCRACSPTRAGRSRWPRPGGCCRRSSPSPTRTRSRSRVAPLAAVRRAADARDLVGLSRPPSSRRAYYFRSPAATATTSRSSRTRSPLTGPAGLRPSACTFPAPACRATPTPSGPATSTPPGASSTPPSRPSTAAWAAPLTTRQRHRREPVRVVCIRRRRTGYEVVSWRAGSRRARVVPDPKAGACATPLATKPF